MGLVGFKAEGGASGAAGTLWFTWLCARLAR